MEGMREQLSLLRGDLKELVSDNRGSQRETFEKIVTIESRVTALEEEVDRVEASFKEKEDALSKRLDYKVDGLKAATGLIEDRLAGLEAGSTTQPILIEPAHAQPFGVPQVIGQPSPLPPSVVEEQKAKTRLWTNLTALVAGITFIVTAVGALLVSWLGG